MRFCGTFASRAAFVVALGLLALSVRGWACSVPVFRYALDRWPADVFRLEIPADAPSPQRLMDSLGADSQPNLRIVRDGNGAAEKEARLFLPNRDDAPVWRGAMDAATLGKLVMSPARANIVGRILSGDSAVWVVIEGRLPADEIVAGLDKRLRYVEQAIALPPIDPNDPTSKLGPGPKLQVKFSTLRVKRDDPAEAELIAMLLGPKRGSLTTDGPVLAPVFGRGRVLGAWPADKMDDDQVSEACQFLCGACSCEVKAQNPGWDLLINCDWDSRLEAAGGPGELVLPPAPAAKPEPTEAVLVPIAAGTPPAPAQRVEPGRGDGRLWVMIGAAALAVCSGLVLALKRR